MLGTHLRVLGGNAVALGHRLRQEHRDVVGEDHADPDDEPAQFAVAGDRQPERQGDQREHEARGRDRELGVDRHDLVVRRLIALLLGRDVRAELCDRLLGQPRGRFERREDRVRVECRDDVIREACAVRLAGPAGRVLACRSSGSSSTVRFAGSRTMLAAPRPGSAPCASGLLVFATSRSFQPDCPGSASSRGIQRQFGNSW